MLLPSLASVHEVIKKFNPLEFSFISSTFCVNLKQEICPLLIMIYFEAQTLDDL